MRALRKRRHSDFRMESKTARYTCVYQYKKMAWDTIFGLKVLFSFSSHTRFGPPWLNGLWDTDFDLLHSVDGHAIKVAAGDIFGGLAKNTSSVQE